MHPNIDVIADDDPFVSVEHDQALRHIIEGDLELVPAFSCVTDHRRE
jgi:hypothetical protein